ncbi:MAG: hypothetical protein VXV77_04730 [Bacteroidota bacterium]|nr:hypothetical protein [Bacteroidota bacterium]
MKNWKDIAIGILSGIGIMSFISANNLNQNSQKEGIVKQDTINSDILSPVGTYQISDYISGGGVLLLDTRTGEVRLGAISEKKWRDALPIINNEEGILD